MSSRTLIGLSVGSGLDGVDAAVVRATGIGLALTPRVDRSARVAFPPNIRDQLRTAAGLVPTAASPSRGPPDITRGLAETAVHAIRTVATQAGVSPRDVFAAGLLEPARSPHDLSLAWEDISDRVAEQTGLTVVHGFRGRDRATGGSGHPITAAADYLLLRSPTEDRILVHVGSAAGLVLAPASGEISAAVAFEVGPGNQFLDALVYHGSRGKEASDPGGRKAVQGCCLDPLLARWLEHPHLTRKPPKALHPDAFGRSFLLTAFDTARQLGAGLPDMLCTATHLLARSIGEACRAWFPAPTLPRRVVLAGGGTRNGFLWQLLGQQFRGIERADAVGLPPLGRNAAAAAVLAALTCDGVAGNLPVWTGAAGGRLIGHLVPGDGRNWARCAAWVADQTGDYPRVNRAA